MGLWDLGRLWAHRARLPAALLCSKWRRIVFTMRNGGWLHEQHVVVGALFLAKKRKPRRTCLAGIVFSRFQKLGARIGLNTGTYEAEKAWHLQYLARNGGWLQQEHVVGAHSAVSGRGRNANFTRFFFLASGSDRLCFLAVFYVHSSSLQFQPFTCTRLVQH